MSKAFLYSFTVNDVVYYHSIDTENDATYLKDWNGSLLYTVNSDADLSDKIGLRIGSFRTDTNGLWYFRFGSSNTTIQTGEKDLIKAELKVFKNLMGYDK